MKNLNYTLALTFLSILSIFALNTKGVLAAEPTLTSNNFTVWNQGNIKGYDVKINLSNTTFDKATDVTLKLYSGDTLLQTNTATKNSLVGTELTAPFDVLGTFNYVSDGYFVNKKEAEYGKKLIPTKVVTTVTLNDGKILSTTNSSLTGDTNTIISNGKVLGENKFNFTQQLKMGSKGNEVIELQKILIEKGYLSSNADGNYGNKTKAAVIKFQAANGVNNIGIVGPATRAILNK